MTSVLGITVHSRRHTAHSKRCWVPLARRHTQKPVSPRRCCSITDSKLQAVSTVCVTATQQGTQTPADASPSSRSWAGREQTHPDRGVAGNRKFREDKDRCSEVRRGVMDLHAGPEAASCRKQCFWFDCTMSRTSRQVEEDHAWGSLCVYKDP